MLNTIFAKKTMMTGAYTAKGQRVGVTVLEVLPMKVADLRTTEKHGYQAVRVRIQENKKKGLLKEIRTEETMEPETEVKLEDIIKVGDKVNISGITKGHGFAGAVKRHHFKGGPRTHGQSDRERAPGSSGPTTTPGRVLKGKRRAGHMGVDKVMIRNLEIISLDAEKRTLTVKGSVPGANRYTLLTITKTI